MCPTAEEESKQIYKLLQKLDLDYRDYRDYFSFHIKSNLNTNRYLHKNANNPWLSNNLWKTSAFFPKSPSNKSLKHHVNRVYLFCLVYHVMYIFSAVLH